MNEENQVYLLKYGDGLLVNTLASLYHLCGEEIQVYPTHDPSDKTSTGAVIRECLFAILKVLINLTHRFNRQCNIKPFNAFEFIRNFNFAFLQLLGADLSVRNPMFWITV